MKSEIAEHFTEALKIAQGGKVLPALPSGFLCRKCQCILTKNTGIKTEDAQAGIVLVGETAVASRTRIDEIAGSEITKLSSNLRKEAFSSSPASLSPPTGKIPTGFDDRLSCTRGDLMLKQHDERHQKKRGHWSSRSPSLSPKSLCLRPNGSCFHTDHKDQLDEKASGKEKYTRRHEAASIEISVSPSDRDIATPLHHLKLLGAITTKKHIR